MARNRLTLAPNVEALAAELFEAVQGDQGRGFISDGMDAQPNRARFFEAVRGHLFHSRLAVRTIVRFLKKYGEYGP